MNTENTKYLLNGVAVNVIETLPNGFLVTNIYEIGEYEDEPIYDDANPYFVKQVFDKAPIEKLDAEVRKCNDKVDAARKEYNELYNKINELKRSEDVRIKKFKDSNIAALQVLEDVIDGVITHFVVQEYNTFTIMEGKKLQQDLNRSEYFLNLKISLIGQLDISYTMYTRHDSYTSFTVRPCKSYEHAADTVRMLVAEMEAKIVDGKEPNASYLASNIISSLEKIGDVPKKEIIEIANNAKRKAAEIEIKRSNDIILHQQKIIDSLSL